MGRSPCCAKEGLNRGAWTAMEDRMLKEYIEIHGEGQWRNLPKRAGLKRCGKSCRLRWLNYLRPDIKRGNITHDEEELIIRLHKLLGNRWSLIAGRLPGRTDNEIKNYWNTKISKKIQATEASTSGQNRLSVTPQPLNQPNPMVKPSSSENSIVIRTKARRCTKVVITNPAERPEPQFSDHHHQPDDPIKSSEFVSKENEPLCSIMGDLEVDESFLADFLDIEFGMFSSSNLKNGITGGNNGTNSPGSDDHSVLYSDDMLHELSDFSPMACLIDTESDWLQN
ncbi:hypothetical protein SLEP1_g13438 [Rubroshorea leprosula]|uniref:Uncharacterized protein n=1 Tax=Rubroshorea leprosula TaxID=152421 RepID=A0AAV5ILM0_9ROSI|nr:hypothetical protein SLEP1_g13438 [Rubroshorea leprosula]